MQIKKLKGMDSYVVINVRKVYIVMQVSTILLLSAVYPQCDALVYTATSSLSILKDHDRVAALPRRNGDAPTFKQQRTTSISKH
jgi:hypothetical protein